MRSTRRREAAEDRNARAHLAEAREGLAAAELAASSVRAPILSALADAEDHHWVRVSIAERRAQAAATAQATGERKGGLRGWRRLFGTWPAHDAKASKDRVHDSTLTFLEGQGEHDSTEDLHPPRLDETEAPLDDALAARHHEPRHKRDLNG